MSAKSTPREGTGQEQQARKWVGRKVAAPKDRLICALDRYRTQKKTGEGEKEEEMDTGDRYTRVERPHCLIDRLTLTLTTSYIQNKKPYRE